METGPSEAVPEEGETLTQESDTLADQSRLAVNVIVPLLPSTLNSMLEGLVIVSFGAFWHEKSISTQRPNNTKELLLVLFITMYLK